MDDDALPQPQVPDLAVILSLLQGAVVPAVSALSVLANTAAGSQAARPRREQPEDARSARQIALRMQGTLDEADTLLRWASAFLLDHNFAHAQVWPAGINAVQLSEEAFERYMEIVNHCCVLIRRTDRDGMELSGYAHALRGTPLLAQDAPTQWQRDLHQAALMQEKVIRAHTFGEKTRLLKLSIRMCRDVLETFRQALSEQNLPPPDAPPRQPGRPA